MILDPDLEVRAGDGEPIDYKLEVTSDKELSLSDISSVELYAWKEGSSSNHVDGGTVSPDGVTATQNSDGTWKIVVDVSFDPVGQAAGGGDAFDTGDEGVYLAYSRVVWSDGDDTRHPNDDDRVWHVLPNREG